LRKLRESFDQGNWYQFLIPAAEALSDWPSVELTHEQVEAVRHGHRIPGDGSIGELARGISEQGELVALLGFDTDTGEWQPKKVFFS
jgi:tRNA pseudouridine55 synthase